MSQAVLSFFRNNTSAIFVGLALMLALGCGQALSQGATGGSLGNDNKSLSGERDQPRSAASARRAKPERRERSETREQPRRAAKRSGESGGGVTKFDGTWSVTSVGETCPDTLTTTAVISNGRITSANDTGTIAANGVSNSVGSYGGITVTAQGRSTANAGSGTFRRSDGCTGRWTAVKQ